MAMAKSLGSQDPHAWAHKLADIYNAGGKLTTMQLSKLHDFERNTGKRLIQVQA